VLTDPSLEPVMANPGNLKEANLGILAYYKPGAGLDMLRNNVLGKERFDKAFRTYTERWAFKHPMPDDFFRTIENVAGEDLGWFWRSWFLNNWRLDQGISKVKYVKGNAKNGATITIENFEKMVMPVVLEIKTKSGAVSRKSLPVEIWERNVDWTFKVDTNEELDSITIDPDHKLPDSNPENNVWTNEKNGITQVESLTPYLGKFSSQQLPIKITFTEEDESLVINSPGQPATALDSKGAGKFSLEQAGLVIQFNEAKDAIKLSVGPQSFDFTRDK
jgi:hypothetical protein